MIYFAQPVGGGPVKIGTAVDVDLRIAQLELQYGLSLVVLATIPGGHEEEADIHERFAHLRFARRGRRGQCPEQFRPDPELMSFIGVKSPVGVDVASVEAMRAERTVVILLKGTAEYADWLERLHRKTLIPKAAMFRDAMREWCERRKYETPPEL